MAFVPPLIQVCATLQAASSQRLASLPHVVDLISAFLDVSPLIALERAAASSSVRLFERVALRHEAHAVDPIDHKYALSLALEAALRADDLAIAQKLHTLHPAPLQVQSLQLAFTNGSLELVQWVMENRNDRLCCAPGIENLCQGCFEFAAETIGPKDPYGVVMWLLETCHLFPWDTPAVVGRQVNVVTWTRSALLQSAALVRACDEQRLLFGTMLARLVDDSLRRPNPESAEIVKYLLEQGYRPSNLDAFADNVIRASCHRDQETLVEIVVNSVVWNPLRHDFVYEATREGGAKVLQWSRAYKAERTRKHGFSINVSLSYARALGHFDTIKWLAEAHGVQVDPPLYRVPEPESLDIIQWLHETENGRWCTAAMDRAACEGQFRLVQWLHEHRTEGCTTSAMDGAASRGHLHVVQWLHENRSEGCSKEALNYAATNGHIGVVEWLHEHRSEGNVPEAMVHAALNGQLPIVQWCADHGGCAHCVHRYLLGRPLAANTESFSSRVLYTLQWIDQRQQGSALSICNGRCFIVPARLLSLSLAEGAVATGDMELLEYLHHQHAELFTRLNRVNGLVHTIVTKLGHVATLQWLFDRYPTSLEWHQLADRAHEHGHKALATWLRTRPVANDT